MFVNGYAIFQKHYFHLDSHLRMIVYFCVFFDFIQILFHLHHTCMYFRWVSSFSTWAMWREEIFSLPVRAWIPTMVTPIGQGAFPIAISR